MTKQERVNQIYEVLHSQRFVNFYGTVPDNDMSPMSKHIVGDIDCLPKEEILKLIERLFDGVL